MRWTVAVLMMSAIAFGQATSSVQENASAAQSNEPKKPSTVIPAGTRVALSLKQAISTKTAKEGDPVYAVSNFPVVVDDRIIIPPGTYVQGKISHIQRGGHVKGRAELMIHFTSLIYPSGYTVMLPGALENVPGAEHATTKGTEGTIQQDSDTGKKLETVAKTAGTGAAIGGLGTGTWKGAGIGGGIGAGVGAAIGMLSRGADVRLEPGTSVEMIIQRDVPVDGSRLPKWSGN
jgi:type IV secretory pathway VirB10-like protein